MPVGGCSLIDTAVLLIFRFIGPSKFVATGQIRQLPVAYEDRTARDPCRFSRKCTSIARHNAAVDGLRSWVGRVRVNAANPDSACTQVTVTNTVRCS